MYQIFYRNPNDSNKYWAGECPYYEDAIKACNHLIAEGAYSAWWEREA